MSEHLSAGCARVEERLAALLDGALAPLDEARDLGHLEACAACRRALQRHQQLLARIAEAVRAGCERDVARVAAALRERLVEREAPRPARRSAPLPARVLVGLAAAAAAVLLLFLLETRAGVAAVASLEPERTWDGVLAHLPSWHDVVRGLDRLSRGLS